MKALVFGSTGLVGRQLVKTLLEKGHAVTGTSRSFQQDLFQSSAYVHVGLDITKREEFGKLNGKFDWVFNTAAYIPKTRLASESLACLQINTIGLQNIMEYMLVNKMNRLIHSSSITVYGVPHKLYVREDSPLVPIIVYGVSKLAAETFCNMYEKLYGFKITMLRYASVYGPGLTQKTALPLFIEKAIKNEDITIYQEGFRSQDYVYSEDTASANLLAAEKDIIGAFNIASGEVTTMENLAKTIISVFSSKSRIVYDNSKPEDFSIGIDIKKAIKELGYVPHYSLREGLEKYRASILY